MVNAYKTKAIKLFLTARPYWVAKMHANGATKMGIPAWHYRSNAYSDTLFHLIPRTQNQLC